MSAHRSRIEDDAFAPIDVQLGALLTRRAQAANASPTDAHLIGLAAAMLSAERARGHSCLSLAELASSAQPHVASPGQPPMSDAHAWRTLLRASALCGDGHTPTPLVLDADRLYLARYHRAEKRLASAMIARLPDARTPEPAPGVQSLFRVLFPALPDGQVDWQAVAAAAALRNRLTIITGGPGTGKTTTVARILALVLQARPAMRIALVAPTGKAAARLAEAIADQAGSLPLDPSLRALLPAGGRTLHRLLGYQPWDDRFAASADDPLTEDLVIVDEASMVDVLLMDALFAALRSDARIILLGDQDQLASVDTGFVLGDACFAADQGGATHGAGLGEWAAHLGGAPLDTRAGASPIRDAVVRLRRSWRFDDHPGISALAAAMRAGDAGAALAVLADAAVPDVALRARPASTGELMAPFAPLFDDYIATADPVQALERFACFRVLCALRDGPSGVGGINDRIERWLRARGTPTRTRWYAGRPVLITANDHATKLYNGDVGVTLADAGVTRVWFPDGAGGVRSFTPSRLPSHETAWAMTVHKAQGSEFAHVMLVLPQDDSIVLTRELLYTAVTRARAGVDIVGDARVLAAGIGRATRRSSGLADRLLAAPYPEGGP